LKTRRRNAIAIVVLIIATLAVGVGWAQAPGGGTSGGRAGKGGHLPAPTDRDPSPIASPENVADRARVQLSDLEEDLRLAPAQRGAWTAYSDKVLKLSEDVVRNRNTVRFPKGSASEQLDFITETLRNRLTAVEDIADAGKALYATLTPGQKATADGRLARIAVPLLVPSQTIAEGGMQRSGDPAANAPRGH
jgi:hypothetical protein